MVTTLPHSPSALTGLEFSVNFVVRRRGQFGRKLKLKETGPEKGHKALRIK
jgi:hypothetical protein